MTSKLKIFYIGFITIFGIFLFVSPFSYGEFDFEFKSKVCHTKKKGVTFFLKTSFLRFGIRKVERWWNTSNIQVNDLMLFSFLRFFYQTTGGSICLILAYPLSRIFQHLVLFTQSWCWNSNQMRKIISGRKIFLFHFIKCNFGIFQKWGDFERFVNWK